MTQDEIIEMAKPFLWGGNVVEGWTFSSYEQLEAFAKLVAEKEREACAEVCDDIHAEHEAKGVFSSYAEAIRARSKHDTRG